MGLGDVIYQSDCFWTMQCLGLCVSTLTAALLDGDSNGKKSLNDVFSSRMLFIAELLDHMSCFLLILCVCK